MNTPKPAYPAQVLVHTVQGPEPCCRKHAQRLAALMQFMGAATNETPAPAGAQCRNCMNEAKSMSIPALLPENKQERDLAGINQINFDLMTVFCNNIGTTEMGGLFFYIGDAPDDTGNPAFVLKQRNKLKIKGEDFKEVLNVDYRWASKQEMRDLGRSEEEIKTRAPWVKLSWD